MSTPTLAESALEDSLDHDIDIDHDHDHDTTFSSTWSESTSTDLGYQSGTASSPISTSESKRTITSSPDYGIATTSILASMSSTMTANSLSPAMTSAEKAAALMQSPPVSPQALANHTAQDSNSDFYRRSIDTEGAASQGEGLHHQHYRVAFEPVQDTAELALAGASPDQVSPIHGYSAENDPVNATPTLEQMGLDRLDELELRMLLQRTYEVVQEKNQALEMAMVMGNSLAEAKLNLETKYQRVLTQLRQTRHHRPRHLTPPKKIILSPPLSSHAGSMALDIDEENWVDFEPPQSALNRSGYPSSPTSAGGLAGAALRRSAHNNMMLTRSRQDMEKLTALEDLNSQLQGKVDAITKEMKQGRRQAFKRHRKAEKELKIGKDELDRTQVKVTDLEEQNYRLIEASRQIRMRRIQLQKQLPAPGSIPGSTMATIAAEMMGDDMTIQEMLAEDVRIFEELKERLQSLERKNLSLQQQKSEADKKTIQMAQELNEMQEAHEMLVVRLTEMSEVQSAYLEQSMHVKELEHNIQELQNQVSTMSSRMSQLNSPLMSPSEPSSPIQSHWRQEDAELKTLKTILHGTSPQPMALRSPRLRSHRRPKRTLLAELESEWFRQTSFFGPPQQAQLPGAIELPGVPKSPKALRDRRHESDAELFSDDASGKVKGWQAHIRDMGEDEACESSSCIRKRRHHRIKYPGAGSASDTDCGHTSGMLSGDGGDSDVEEFHRLSHPHSPHTHLSLPHHQHFPRKRRSSGESGLDLDDDSISDCSDPHHLHHERPSTPGCCCHHYNDYDSYTSYDSEVDDLDEEENVEGWAHFVDYDVSMQGYDKYRDGYYVYRRRRGIIGMVQGVILLFRLFWRWCRFLFILSTALGLAIYRGPDALLTDGHY